MNKKLKVSVFAVIFVLLLSVIIPFDSVKASSIDNSILFQSNNIFVQIVEENKDCQKVKFMYLDTGEVEYLEYYNNNGESVYNVTESDGITTHVIQKEDNEIYIDDQLVLNLEDQDYSDIPDKSKTASAWKKTSTLKYNSNIYIAGASLIAGVLVSLLGGPLSGIITSIASCIASLAIRTIYYSVTYYQSTATYGLGKQDYTVYRYSNYTGKLGSGSYQYYYARPN